MPFLQTEVIAAYASTAGFKESDLPTAVAIAMAESGQHSEAHNNNAATGDDSYGLWQINMRGALGPNRRKEFGLANNKQLLDPLSNALAAKKIHDARGGWSDWTTYKNGKHTPHMGQATRAVALMHTKGDKWRNDVTKNHAQLGNKEVSGDGTQKAVGEGGDGTETHDGLFGISGAIGNAFSALTKTIETFALNSLGVTAALVFIVIGVVILLRAPISSVASKATPIGKAAKLAKAVG